MQGKNRQVSGGRCRLALPLSSVVKGVITVTDVFLFLCILLLRRVIWGVFLCSGVALCIVVALDEVSFLIIVYVIVALDEVVFLIALCSFFFVLCKASSLG